MDNTIAVTKCKWAVREDGSARLLRLYGTSPVVQVPEKIENHIITEIAPYCFAPGNKNLEKQAIETDLAGENEGMDRELAGDFLQEVTLPETVISIGNNAFYNCRKLEKLRVGTKTTEVGSDVFMNCHKLHNLAVGSGMEEPSGLKQLLSRISATVEVTFTNGKLLYPEYFEGYEEIAPAHIFGLNIEGEGFRLRQQFAGGVVLLDAYDKTFAKASAEESVEIVGKMALNRLLYPTGLGTKSREEYQDYVTDHQGEIVEQLVAEKKLKELEYICEKKLLSSRAVDAAIAMAADQEWSQGSASLLSWKQKYYSKRERYAF